MPTLPLFELGPAGKLANEYGRFCQSLMKQQFDIAHPFPNNKNLRIKLRIEAYQMVSVVHEAYGNPLHLQFNFDDLASHILKTQMTTNDPRDVKLRSQFPPHGRSAVDGGLLPLCAYPTTFVDRKGTIGWWYLPGSVADWRQDAIFRAVQALASQTGGSLRMAEGGNWRSHPHFFHLGEELNPGVTTFSACWFQQAHDQGPDHKPSPSASLRQPSSQQFIRDMTESLAVLGGFIAVTQPWLFDAGLQVLEALQLRSIDLDNPELLASIIDFWSNPFTAFSVITNRETPIHRDINSPPWAYDLIYTGGLYDNGRFESPTLGYRFLYNPGTVMVGLGSLIQHGVAPVDGDRVCVVSYFRTNMLDRASNYGSARPPSMTQFKTFYTTTPM